MEPSLVLSSAVMIGMGFAALVFSVTSSLRSRALRRLPQDLLPRVYSKTFNVFEPNTKSRKTIGSHTGLAVFMAIYGSWIAVTFLIFKTYEFGGLLSCIIFVLCAGLLMIEETFELNKNAALLAKAVSSGKGLANGDMEVLKVVKSSLPRISGYHLFLAVVFFASAIAIQEIMEAFFFASTWIAAVVLSLSASVAMALPWGQPLPSIIVVAGVAGTVIVLLLHLGGRTKKKLFGFPPTIPVDVLSRQFFRMRMFVGIQHHHPFLHEPSPEETDKGVKRDIEEHAES
jgi:hypothetical protein